MYLLRNWLEVSALNLAATHDLLTMCDLLSAFSVPSKTEFCPKNWVIASQTSSFEETTYEVCIFLSMFHELIQGKPLPIFLELDPLSKFSFSKRNHEDDCLEPVCFRWIAGPQNFSSVKLVSNKKDEVIMAWRLQEYVGWHQKTCTHYIFQIERKYIAGLIILHRSQYGRIDWTNFCKMPLVRGRA